MELKSKEIWTTLYTMTAISLTITPSSNNNIINNTNTIINNNIDNINIYKKTSNDNNSIKSKININKKINMSSNKNIMGFLNDKQHFFISRPVLFHVNLNTFS